MLVAVAAGATQMFCGAPEIILITWLIGGLLVAIETDALRRLPLIAWRFCRVGLLTMAICAIQLLPFFDLLMHSNRNTNLANAVWSMPPSGLANFFLPIFRMIKGAPGILAQPGQYWTLSYYISLPLLAFALCAVLTLRRAAPRVLGLLVVIGLTLALGERSYLFRWIQETSGLLGWMRFPVKMVIVTTFCLPLLAAYAMAGLPRKKISLRRNSGWFAPVLSAVAVAGVTLAVMAVALTERNPVANTAAILANGLVRVTILAAVFGFLILAASLPPTDRRRILLPIGCLFLIWLDLRTHLPCYNPTVQSAILAPGIVRLEPQPEFGKTRAMVSPGALRQLAITRYSPNRLYDCYGKRIALFFDSNLLEGIPKTDGFFSMYPREEFQLQSRLYSRSAGRAPADGILDFLGVVQLTAPGRLAAFSRRRTNLPFVTGGQRPVFATDTESLDRIVSDTFDPRLSVILPVHERGHIGVYDPQPVTIRGLHVAAQRISFTAEARQPALVVISQSYYHHWKPTVNGHARELLRANHAYQAVEIPAGRSHVLLRYEDRPFRFGALITAFALLGCLAIWCWGCLPLRPRP